jgi:hypothetical protein
MPPDARETALLALPRTPPVPEADPVKIGSQIAAIGI